ncbi:enoyl-CoA hydratase/isomerase family protein [Yimella sp. cx-573]|nr:enoyl-CoA hydratase/isomerase family protein [Yimella sp. cx-573]
MSEVQLTVEGRLGRIVLVRPKALNALTLEMVTAIDAQLQQWATDPQVQFVSIEGAGERGLCAGGDVVAVRRAVVEGEAGQEFFAAEYAMNARLASYPKPTVVFQDGFVLGGGVGVSAHCAVRLATERTKVAMPETIIGFFPDVGAMHLLARAPGEIGTHLALTGQMISGADAVFAGLSDAVVDSSLWPGLLQDMRDGSGASYSPLPIDSELAAQQHWIDECYAGDDAAVIVERLSTSTVPEARAAAELIRQRSPYSVCVTLAALRRARAMETVDEVLAQDLRIAAVVSHHPDFAEGVRAQLVDKDRSPRWTHGSVADVPTSEVEAAFAG